MPNYAYTCRQCGKESLIFQKITDEPLRVCPDCGGELVRLLSGGAAVIYKGSGFYVNDYKKKDTQAAAGEKVAVNANP